MTLVTRRYIATFWWECSVMAHQKSLAEVIASCIITFSARIVGVTPIKLLPTIKYNTISQISDKGTETITLLDSECVLLV